jgi:phosphoglycerate dehydrogenase-like enzyme
MSIKVLYAVPTAHEAALPVLERLRAEGSELTFNRTGRTLTEDELIGLLPGVFATIAGGEPYTERVFAAAPELKVVARMGVGYDKVDVAVSDSYVHYRGSRRVGVPWGLPRHRLSAGHDAPKGGTQLFNPTLFIC